MNDRQFKSEVFEQLARVGKALASPKRLELLDVLAQGPRTVEVVADEASMTVANASQHLRVLRSARLVEAEKQGLFVTYRIASGEVTAFLRSLRTLAENRLADIERVTKNYLKGREGMEKVDRETLLRRVREGRVTVLDVRPAEEFKAGHIPGAVSVPLAELRRRMKSLPRNREVVAYCRGPYCVLAVKAVELLRQEGFRASRLEDGVPDWRAQGFDVEVEA
ncbi:MAG TPA: ArsR family transcriptional regulator [Verrucomicrobia bacterium]|nr:MAG: ArsR family transcriptional regulator [Lentisphaerae bacterium GWF2_57_35]HBA83140.1 ArsR family transcriptional regulator [Verrucomicrobiota bacterium]